MMNIKNALLILAISSTPILAQDTLISQSGSMESDTTSYREVSGLWEDRQTNNSAEGLSSDHTGRVLAGDEPGILEFSFTVNRSGIFAIEYTYPEMANAANVAVVVSGRDGTIAQESTSFSPASGANQWHEVARAVGEPGSAFTIRLESNPADGVSDDSLPYLFAVDAARLVFHGESTEMDSADMGTTPEGDSSNPFTRVRSPRQVDATDNPFGEAQQAPTSQEVIPEATPAPTPEPTAAPRDPSNPFASAPSPRTVDRSDNPFGSQPAAERQTEEPAAAESPFDSQPVTAPQEESVPSPFATRPAQESEAPTPDNPFGDFTPSPGATPAPTRPDARSAPTGDSPFNPPPVPRETMSRVGQFAPDRPDRSRNIPEIQPDQDLASAQAQTFELNRVDSLDDAFARALEERKVVLLVFTDFTRQSSNFREDILSNNMVKEAAENFLVVEKDIRENRQIAERYNARSAPYSVVLDPRGFTLRHIVEQRDAGRYAEELREVRRRP